jgi:hypothetical protein
MNKNVLLFCMIICYLLPIYYVYNNYYLNNSLSNIICNNNCKYYILFFMFLMSIPTLLYEIERNDKCSIFLISILLLGIYGLILIDETNIIHYMFASIVFIVILTFMIRHYYITNNIILFVSLILQLFLLLLVIININKNIFYGEILYILNFAFYYLYLHCIQ